MSGRNRRDSARTAPPSTAATTAATDSGAAEKRLAVLVTLFAAAVRLWGIGSAFPILTDEAIYLRWAEIIDHQGQWLISLLDGKPPLSYWIYAVARFVWDGDPLLATRSISAAAGGCTTLLLFGIGKRLHSGRAGLVAAAAYAVFPWAMVHDRLGLAEAMIAGAGAGVVYLSLRAFENDEESVRRDVLVGLALGLALFIKTTAILFAPAVAILAFGGATRTGRQGLIRIARIYAVAGVFPLLSMALTPQVSTLETTSALVHEASRFVTFGEFTSAPFATLMKYRFRFAALIDYVTWPGLAFGLASLSYFTWKRSMIAWVFWGVCVLPTVLQLLMLNDYVERYAYPHIWPWMLLLGAGRAAAVDALGARFPTRRTLSAAAVAGIILGPMALKSALILNDPEANTNSYESGRYFGSYPHVGYGVPESVEFLRGEARRNGGLTLLTVPLWGVPADAFAAYLNERDGIRVYEAWWLQLEGGQPIMPLGKAEMIRSHYERVSAGSLDFRRIPRVYFATDSELMARSQVAARQPTARLLVSFDKPGGESSIDVYRLK